MTTYDHKEARCLFIDGPIAIYLSEAPASELYFSLANIIRMVDVAVTQLGESYVRNHPQTPVQNP